jgi:hypothetical protein
MAVTLVVVAIACLAGMACSVLFNHSKNFMPALIFMAAVAAVLMVAVPVYLANDDSKNYCSTNWRGFDIRVDKQAGEVTIERKETGFRAFKVFYVSLSPIVEWYDPPGARITISNKDWRGEHSLPQLNLLNYGTNDVLEMVKYCGLFVIDENACEVRPVDQKSCNELDKEE